MVSPVPPTLLTLRFSSPSFLETILTHAGQPLYSTETTGNTTSLSRCDPQYGLALVANIHWPEHARKGPAQVVVDGSSRSEDELLKRNCLNTSRKFRVPGHSHSFKWRRVQGVFQCTSTSGSPVAVFEPAILTAPARLTVFDTTEPQMSALVVDYLIVTALLLLTHPEDWRGFASDSHPVRSSSSSSTLPMLQIPPTAHVTPYTYSPVSSVSDSSYQQSPETTYGAQTPAEEECCGAERASVEECQRVGACAVLPQIKEDVVEYEPPPPYEEIQWTVRVRQPRRRA